MKLNLVLVRTEFSGNIGASARAMANMGADRMILIDPRCTVDGEARQMAAGARDALERICSHPNWQSFYEREPDGLRLALTRRGGRKRKVFSLEEKLGELSMPDHLYLILGPESDGLDAADLAYVHFACHLPVYGEFASMNLAQAALLGLFQVRQRFPPHELPQQVTGDNPSSAQPFYFPDALIKNWLTAMGFDVSARRASAYLTLRRLFLQNQPTRHEMQVLESVLNQNIRKLQADRVSLGLTTEEVTNDLCNIPVK